LKEDHISLVLWQTGTVEAVRGLSPSDLEDALSEGARAILDAGADGILIDPQYSHFLHANVDLEPYEQALEHVASLFPHLTLFRRFELMHSWADDGVLDLERMEPDERHAAIARLHQCLGAALTRFIMHGVEQSAEQ
ncbi:MAG: hypothetical protein JO212_14665, partial [Acetobacteraceae bacterium]|nr:hypothetical protein [Acetobacteraceae bacterium]